MEIDEIQKLKNKVAEILTDLDNHSKAKEDEVKQKKAELIAKLQGTEYNYFIILKEDNFKTFGVNADNYDSAYDMCSEILPNDDEFHDNWVLNREEMELLVESLNNITFKSYVGRCEDCDRMIEKYEDYATSEDMSASNDEEKTTYLCEECSKK